MDETPHSRYSPFLAAAPVKTPKAARTRNRILRSAAELFLEHGYHKVSMQDVANATGLTKSGVYGHFRTKGQLLIAVIRWQYAEREHAEYFQEALETPGSAVTLLFDERGRDLRLLLVEAAVAARHDPAIAAELVALEAERTAAIREAIPSDGISDEDTVVWLVATLSAGIGFNDALNIPPPDAQRLLGVLLGGISAASGNHVLRPKPRTRRRRSYQP